MEATVDGLLVEDEGDLGVVISATGERIDLAPLERKVQWDRQAKRAELPTPAERAAYAQLRRCRTPQLLPVRVTGPLEQVAGKERLTLQVREFELLRQ